MTDPIAIFEAAYAIGGDERAWLFRLADAVRKSSSDDRWIVAHTFDATRQHLVTREMSYCGLEKKTAHAMLDQLAGLRTAFSDCRPGEQLFRKSFVVSLSAAPAALRRVGLDESRVRELERELASWFRRWELNDELWVNAQDSTGVGCSLVAPLRSSRALSARDVHRWRCVAAHVITAFRARRQLSAWTPATMGGADDQPEAIFGPDGKLEHAEKRAQSEAARAALRRSVRALDRARGPLRRRDPEAAVAIWQALVAGRWSLLDHFDSDGRRYVIAHRNDVALPDARGLTLRERQVIAYAALGHANKVIAYELGLSTSTVAGHLAKARGKLQSPSVAALQHIPRTDRPAVNPPTK